MRGLARVLRVVAIAVTALAVAASAGTTRDAAAALPPGNTVAQWNKIAEDTVVGSGAFQWEGFIYMAYVSAAVYDAVVAIEGGFEPYGPRSRPLQGRRSTQRWSRPPTGRLGLLPARSCNPTSPAYASAWESSRRTRSTRRRSG